MTRAFIWDLDGTLLDSYEAILDGIAETYAHYSIDFDGKRSMPLFSISLSKLFLKKWLENMTWMQKR